MKLHRLNCTRPVVGMWLALFFFISAPTNALAATSIYIAQSAQGANNGSSCANARPASWFNSGANWGTGASQISPGATVFLCGNIATSLTIQGNGTNGNYVTVDGTGATMSGSFSETDRSWWKIQNVTWSRGFAAPLLTLRGGSNGVFTNNYADDFSGGNAIFLGQNAPSRPNGITISDNFIRTATTDFGNSQHDIIVTEGSINVIVEGNYLEMRAAGSGNYAHNDVIQTYEKGGSSGGPPSNWTIRYNKIVMNSVASNDRSWTMLENLTGTNYIYGNLFLGLKGADSANGLCINSSGSGVVFNIKNNTFVAKSGASNNVLSLQNSGTVNLTNNIIHTVDQTALITGMTIHRDHNLWFGSNIPSCVSTEICGQDPRFTAYSSNDFSLQSSSPAKGSGSNLASPYDKYIVPTSSWPDPALAERPISGNWEIGAYGAEIAGSGAPLAAPENLKVLR